MSKYLSLIAPAFFVLCSFAVVQCSSTQDSSTGSERSAEMEGPGCVAGDCVNGDGIMVYDDKSRYEGTFKDGKRNGKGTLTYANGEVYKGGFVDDQRSGAGEYTFANGDRYVGEFKAGLREGQGVYTFNDGSSYDGSFNNDGVAGKGAYIEDSNSRDCNLKDKSVMCAIADESRKAIQTPQEDEPPATRFEGNR